MKAGQILRLAGQNYLNALPEQHRDAATNQLNVVLSAADTFNADLARVSADPKLSPEGRGEARRKVAAATLATLQAVNDTAIKTLKERTAALEQTLLTRATPPPPKDPGERVAYEMRLQEIRGQLRELPASERLNVYRTTDDPMTLVAIEHAPMTLSQARPDGFRRLEAFVDPDQMQAARLERAERADPATATTLREVRSLLEVYSHAVKGVRNEVIAEVPL